MKLDEQLKALNRIKDRLAALDTKMERLLGMIEEIISERITMENPLPITTTDTKGV